MYLLFICACYYRIDTISEMINTDIINKSAIQNLNKVKLTYLFFPLLLLAIIAGYLYVCDAWSMHNYIRIQEAAFFFLNLRLSEFPEIIYNLTQLGDALIILSLLAILLIYIPSIWEPLISASLISCVLCCSLKWLVRMPRPAAVLERDSFVIVGKVYVGYNSLPSGHAITIFTTFTVLLFALMPKANVAKLVWTILIVSAAILISLTRVGVGAHYILDITFGSIIGYISAILGILFNRSYRIWRWIGDIQYYPFLILLLMTCTWLIIVQIIDENLAIYYLSSITLLMTIYIMTKHYVKK